MRKTLFFLLLMAGFNLHAAENELAGKADDNVTQPYSKQYSPHTFEKYKSRNKEITKLRTKAAKIALQSGKCDYVLFSEIHNRGHGTVDNIDFYVDCRNLNRFLFNEKDIKENRIKEIKRPSTSPL